MRCKVKRAASHKRWRDRNRTKTNAYKKNWIAKNHTACLLARKTRTTTTAARRLIAEGFIYIPRAYRRKQSEISEKRG